MKKQTVINAIMLMVILSPVAYLLIAWNRIPAHFVTTFDLDTVSEKVQTRRELAVAVVLLSVVSAAVYFLLRNLKRVDPKVTVYTPTSPFIKLGLAIALFFTIVSYILILSAKNAWVISSNMVFAFLGLLVAVIGNYMNHLKPNYIAGIRLPWTLNDHDNWRRTHQFAAKLWFAAGLLIVVTSLLVDKAMLLPFIITLFVIIVLIPGIYSYRIYRRNIH